jgi:hypothetical protein
MIKLELNQVSEQTYNEIIYLLQSDKSEFTARIYDKNGMLNKQYTNNDLDSDDYEGNIKIVSCESVVAEGNRLYHEENKTKI